MNVKEWPKTVDSYEGLKEVMEASGKGRVYVRTAGNNAHLPTDTVALWWYWETHVGFAAAAIHPHGVLLDFTGMGYPPDWKDTFVTRYNEWWRKRLQQGRKR